VKQDFYKNLKIILNSLKKYKLAVPKIGIILGSGLGAFLEKIEGIEIPFSEIRGFPQITVHGHKGVLKMGADIAICAGRFHFYEGYSIDEVVLPIFLLHALGVRTVILTNAAGGINSEFLPGDLVLIKDHLNLMGVNPLIGANRETWGPRFPDSSDIYSKDLRELVKNQYASELKEGIYAGMPGPSYETPAEIQMLKRLGADMVGMSTVPEALAATYLSLKVIGISCITNMAAGISNQRLSHEEVLETGKRVAGNLSDLLFSVLTGLRSHSQDKV